MKELKPDTAGNTPEPQTWMRDAAREIVKDQQEYDAASFPLPKASLAGIIAKHYASQVAAPSQEAAPPKFRPLPDIRRALAESIEQALWNRQQPDSRTETWEKRVGLIESAFNAYETAVRAEPAPSPAIKCKHCGQPMFDNGTVGVHIRFVNGALLQSQWCDDSKKVFAEPDFAVVAPSPATKDTPPKCPTCGSDDRKVRYTGRLGAMDITCTHYWHTAVVSQGPAREETLDKIITDILKLHGHPVTHNSKALARELFDAGAQSRTPTNLESRTDTASREPHDGWMNTWMYNNVPRDQNCAYLWNPEVRKFAGDWADFRVANLESRTVAPQPDIQQWIDTELWNFAHGLALDLGVSHDAAGDKAKEQMIHRSMASVIVICSKLAGAAALPSRDRSDKDYAIEHGGYLADAAEQFLDKNNLYSAAQDDEEPPDPSEMYDHNNRLRSAIYEFRKRAKRAAIPSTPIKFPAHKCGLFLTHNEHRDYYEKLADYLAQHDYAGTFESPEAMRRSLATDEHWHLQWYPDTPIGFYQASAPTLAEVLRLANDDEPEATSVPAASSDGSKVKLDTANDWATAHARDIVAKISESLTFTIDYDGDEWRSLIAESARKPELCT